MSSTLFLDATSGFLHVLLRCVPVLGNGMCVTLCKLTDTCYHVLRDSLSKHVICSAVSLQCFQTI